MIKVGYEEQTDKGYISFGGSPRFYDILSLVKSRKFRFNPQEKIWETTPKKLLDTLTELGDYDDVNVSTEVKNKLQQSSKDQYGAKETVFQRNKLVDNYFKYPPIQGKEPNEDFQTECIQKGINTNRHGFFLGMGSGKSYCSITIFNHHFEQGNCDKLLIVTPPEGVYNWRRELKTFASFIDNPDKDIVISSAQHNRDPFSLDYDPKIIIMTYRHFLTWSDDYYKWQNNGKKSTKYRKPVIPFENWGDTRGIILDESHCFARDTLVDTNKGKLKIADIVNNNLDVKILSYNHDKNLFEYKSIVNRFKHTVPCKDTVAVSNNMRGYTLCTKDHWFYTTNNTYKSIKDIDFDTESVFTLPRNFFYKKEKTKILFSKLCSELQFYFRREYLSKLWKNFLYKTFQKKKILLSPMFLRFQKNKNFKKMRVVWRRFLCKIQKFCKKILFQKLLCQMENVSKRNKRKNIHKRSISKNKKYQKESFRERSIQRVSKKNVRENEEEQSNVSAEEYRENERIKKRSNISFKRWKRKDNGTAKKTLRKFGASSILLRVSSSYFTCKRYISKFTKLLQSRYRYTRNKVSNRSRWSNPLNQKMEISRQKKRGSTRSFGLESYKILEREYNGGYEHSSSEDIQVYNLEVADNNNYFADNFLVHNCIKNVQARQSRVLHIHKRFFYYRYLLTGTPSPNSFTELYSQMFFLDSGLLPDNYYEWLEDVANLGNRFSAYAVNFIYPKKQQEWEKLFSDWVTRYTSDEILDLPELYVKNIYAEMGDLQKDIYEHLINYMITILKEENDGRLEPKLLVNKFAYISLAYENANLLKGKIDPQRSQKLSKLVERFNFSKHHGKIEILDSLLDQYINNEGHKVTVFDFHPDTLEELAKRYKKYNPIVIHGQSTPKGEDQDEFRSKELDKFRNSGKHNLLLASSKVLSTAVNITECKRVIYFSRSFSYVDYAQSIKRFHRIGQEDPVIVNNLVFENSLDVRLDKALKEKKDLDDSIFNKESLGQNDWKAIFKGDK